MFLRAPSGFTSHQKDCLVTAIPLTPDLVTRVVMVSTILRDQDRFWGQFWISHGITETWPDEWFGRIVDDLRDTSTWDRTGKTELGWVGLHRWHRPVFGRSSPFCCSLEGLKSQGPWSLWVCQDDEQTKAISMYIDSAQFGSLKPQFTGF